MSETLSSHEQANADLRAELETAHRTIAELRQQQRTAEANAMLRLILEGTASATGDEFFRLLVKYLATVLEVRYSFIATFAKDQSKIRTLAFWEGDGWRDNFEYPLDVSPCAEVIKGELIHYPEQVRAHFPKDRDLICLQAESYLGVPLIDPDSGTHLGHLAVMDTRPLPSRQRSLMVFRIFAQRATAELLRQQAERRRHQAERELRCLREELRIQSQFRNIIGGSEALCAVLRNVELVAATDSTVLILGETGTGKELIARAIHELSTRQERSLVKVNCSALPENLVESELFGHERGAFTGATTRRAGRFELADGGTIFLDEIGDMPLSAQTKLLRVLQEQSFERIGGGKTLSVDVRVLAATNRDLEQAIRQGHFREDLYYRLNVFPLTVPPLRERRADIDDLVAHFVGYFARKIGRHITTIPDATLARLRAYSWPGNVRELENIIERAVILSTSETLEITDAALFDDPPRADHGRPPMTLVEAEKAHILATLELTDGVVDGTKGAARLLGINPSTLRSRMRKLGIPKPHS